MNDALKTLQPLRGTPAQAGEFMFTVEAYSSELEDMWLEANNGEYWNPEDTWWSTDSKDFTIRITP
jgi:hypothetical protein